LFPNFGRFRKASLDLAPQAAEKEGKLEYVLPPSDPKGGKVPPPPRPSSGRDGTPGWAAGLRKLYDSVVDEPLPDSFEDLLKKLDQAKDDG